MKFFDPTKGVYYALYRRPCYRIEMCDPVRGIIQRARSIKAGLLPVSDEDYYHAQNVALNKKMA